MNARVKSADIMFRFGRALLHLAGHNRLTPTLRHFIRLFQPGVA